MFTKITVGFPLLSHCSAWPVEKHELQAVADALAAVAPVSVLWKLTAADQQMLGIGNATLGSNIRLIQWAPQNDVLGHPATRAFLTQAGTNSFNEVCSAAPLGGIICVNCACDM